MDTEYDLLIEVSSLRSSDFLGEKLDTLEYAVESIVKGKNIAFSFYKDDSIDSAPEFPLTDVPLLVKVTFLMDDVKEYSEKIAKAVFSQLKIIFSDRRKDPLMLLFFSETFSG